MRRRRVPFWVWRVLKSPSNMSLEARNTRPREDTWSSQKGWEKVKNKSFPKREIPVLNRNLQSINIRPKGFIGSAKLPLMQPNFPDPQTFYLSELGWSILLKIHFSTHSILSPIESFITQKYSLISLKRLIKIERESFHNYFSHMHYDFDEIKAWKCQKSL